MLIGRRTLAVMAQQQPQLDRSAFKQVISVPAVRVPTKKCQELMGQLRGWVLCSSKLRSVLGDMHQG